MYDKYLTQSSYVVRATTGDYTTGAAFKQYGLRSGGQDFTNGVNVEAWYLT